MYHYHQGQPNAHSPAADALKRFRSDTLGMNGDTFARALAANGCPSFKPSTNRPDGSFTPVAISDFERGKRALPVRMIPALHALGMDRDSLRIVAGYATIVERMKRAPMNDEETSFVGENTLTMLGIPAPNATKKKNPKKKK